MEGDVQQFTSSVHDASVLAGLKALYEGGLLLDVTLVIDDQQFRAHKALLATQSDYFKKMFTAESGEGAQDNIPLQGLTATAFSHILKFMYYGSIELSMNTVYEILQAAINTKLKEVVNFCCSFLLSRISLENSGEILKFLDDFGITMEGAREKLFS
ncbi:kelch-like protein 15 [Antechinus flavipes]|uniref:kelch-like protein 15 n=1 Tax=Antechinus flavipes TaxID=38775 RepID=UPI002236477A|nr:kelch-like protein 15 [Antechinus flavipes]XP_051824476.1 kelch-like protein 15 [Antechinus flavipes]